MENSNRVRDLIYVGTLFNIHAIELDFFILSTITSRLRRVDPARDPNVHGEKNKIIVDIYSTVYDDRVSSIYIDCFILLPRLREPRH